jgi:hypothetical protein
VYPATWIGRILTMVAIFFAMVFTAMPISIVGDHFGKEWDARERYGYLLAIQKAMIDQHLIIDDVMTLFANQDPTVKGTIGYTEWPRGL